MTSPRPVNTPRRCAYLTMDALDDFVSDADLTHEPLRALGWDIRMVSWRATDTDWDQFDLVYICTPWDYQQDPGAFLDTLRAIHDSSAKLVNDLAIVEWNLDKRYLRELEQLGVAIVPSQWHDDFDPHSINQAFAEFGAEKLVIKPVVGANADDTFVLQHPPGPGMIAKLSRLFKDRPHFIQPFIDNVVTEGEFSLFFFGGKYSHTILKTPEDGDFRTQEEHGSTIAASTPPTGLVETAAGVIARVQPEPVYARADFVRAPGHLRNHGEFLLMELELIEPSLYFRTDPESAARFARALDAFMSAG